MRRSDELRPAWACSACSGRSLPWRAVRLTFPSLYPVYGRACPSQGLPWSESAMTTRPNHPLPRQDFHLRACPRLMATHRKSLLRAPARSTERCAGELKYIRRSNESLRSACPRKHWSIGRPNRSAISPRPAVSLPRLSNGPTRPPSTASGLERSPREKSPGAARCIPWERASLCIASDPR